MSEAKVVTCRHCGQKNRIRAAASGPPHCGRCGRPLPWLAATGAADFGEVVEGSPVPVLVDFWAPWCGPCKIVEPAVERISEELAGRLKVAKVNTDQEPALSERFGIRGIPTPGPARGWERAGPGDRGAGLSGPQELGRAAATGCSLSIRSSSRRMIAPGGGAVVSDGSSFWV